MFSPIKNTNWNNYSKTVALLVPPRLSLDRMMSCQTFRKAFFRSDILEGLPGDHGRASPERLVGTRRLGLQYMQGNEVWWPLYSVLLTLITLIQFKFNSPLYRAVACFPFMAMGRGRSFGIMQRCCKEGCCNQSLFSCARSPEAWVMGCWEWKHGRW